MKLISLVFCFFLGLKFLAQNWEQIQSIPAAGRDDGVAFSLNGLGYIVTGNQNGFSESNRLFQYYPESDVWQESTTFPGEPRQYAGSFVLGGFAYLFCGLSASNEALNDVWQFNPKAQEWKRLSDFPGKARWSFFTFSTDRYGFLGTGATLQYGIISDCWKYNPEIDSWSSIPDFPESEIREVGGFCLGENCYAGTGLKFNPLRFYKSFYRYSLTENKWYQIQDYPGEGRSYTGMENVGNKAIVGGGWGEDNTFFQDVYEFSLEKGWTKIADFPFQGWRGMASFSIGSTAYFLSGLYEDLTRTSDVMRYTVFNDEESIIFPNPSVHSAVLYNNFGGRIEIFNFLGQKVHEMLPTAEGYQTLPKLSSGTYLVKVSKESKLRLLKWVIL